MFYHIFTVRTQFGIKIYGGNDLDLQNIKQNIDNDVHVLITFSNEYQYREHCKAREIRMLDQ